MQHVVDQGQHTIAAFDAETLSLIGFCGEYAKRSGTEGMGDWYAEHQADAAADMLWFSRDEERKSGLFLNCPTDIAAHEGELYITDTHNNRVVCISINGACLGVIGSRGEEVET